MGWGKKPRIHLDKLCESKKRGGLSLPNIKYYGVAFEMSKLTRHWDEAGAYLDWVLMERELTFPFKPIEVLAQTVKFEKNKESNPILGHSKMVWQEVHKRRKISQYIQKYASIGHNPKIKINRQLVCWAQFYFIY